MPLRVKKEKVLAAKGRFLMRPYVFALLISIGIAKAGMSQAIRINSFKPRPQLTLGDTLSVSASPSVVSITLVGKGTAVASSSITINTTSSGLSLFSSFALYAYFASAAAALSGSSPVSYIPSSAVLGRCPTGTPTTYTAFTSTVPFGGAAAGLQVYSQTALLSLGVGRTDVLSLEIDLASVPQLPAANYTGSMFLQAQAF